jgi:hypothetical protein
MPARVGRTSAPQAGGYPSAPAKSVGGLAVFDAQASRRRGGPPRTTRQSDGGLLVRTLGREGTSDPVGRIDRLLTVDGGLPGLRVPSAQAGGLHQPVNPLAGQPMPDRGELGTHATPAGDRLFFQDRRRSGHPRLRCRESNACGGRSGAELRGEYRREQAESSSRITRLLPIIHETFSDSGNA